MIRLYRRWRDRAAEEEFEVCSVKRVLLLSLLFASTTNGSRAERLELICPAGEAISVMEDGKIFRTSGETRSIIISYTGIDVTEFTVRTVRKDGGGNITGSTVDTIDAYRDRPEGQNMSPEKLGRLLLVFDDIVAEAGDGYSDSYTIYKVSSTSPTLIIRFSDRVNSTMEWTKCSSAKATK